MTAKDPGKTERQFGDAMSQCRDIFHKKLYDYKPSWRMLRPSSLTDQLFIKAKRIRSIEVKGRTLVGEGILPEFMAIINYGIVGLIQLSHGYVDEIDMTNDEAWRGMRTSSYTDFILTKIERIKEIENHGGRTTVSEGIGSNYMDIINYATFGVIKLTEHEEG